MINDSYLIKGGKPLIGEVKLSGAKNVALKLAIAGLFFDQPVKLINVPRIKDIDELFLLIRTLGGKAEWVAENTAVVNGQTINRNKISLLHGSKLRVSFMFFPVLLKKFQRCFIPNPGGCRIGARPIDRSVAGMNQLGVKTEYNHQTGFYVAEFKEILGQEFCFSKPTHTGTELLILLSLLGKKPVTLRNCALEPEIDQLCDFLSLGGVKIIRRSTTIFINPIDRLKQPKPFKIISDRNEAVTYACLGIASGGAVTVSPIQPRFIESFIDQVKKVNGGVKLLGSDRIKFFRKGNLKSSTIETTPHPGFMTDWQPNWAILMTQAIGCSVIKERVFENRFSYVEELRKLGAKIEFFHPRPANPEKYYFFNWQPKKNYLQAIKIYGPTKLHGGILNINDLRAGASLAVAALIAKGETVINNVSILERGYENFVEKISRIGGEIKKI